MRPTLEAGLNSLSIAASDQQIQSMLDYLVLLEKWNAVHNLTAITKPEDMVNLHVLDSLSVLSDIRGPKVLDVGSGGGLPGMILAIMRPDIEISSIDTRGKKIQFQTMAAASLGLKNFHAIHSRVEDFQPSEAFHQVISRAFSSLENFIAWTQHLIAEQGEWLAMKGQFPEQELQDLKATYGLVPSRTRKIQLPNIVAERHVLTFTTAT